MDWFEVVFRTPLSAAGVVLDWLPVLLVTLWMRRYLRYSLLLEWCWWFAAFTGIALATLHMYRLLDRPLHPGADVTGPPVGFAESVLITAIGTVMWPLIWTMLGVAASYSPERVSELSGQFIVASIGAALISGAMTWALRSRDRRSVARQERLDQG